jgi:hypothetical protein
MINLRKLVAVDLLIHGKRFILVEFALGIVLPLLLGIFSIRSGLSNQHLSNWQTILGISLLGIGTNYIALFLNAILISRKDTVREEGQSELAHVRRYGAQQVVILIPMLVVIVALLQEMRHPQLK